MCGYMQTEDLKISPHLAFLTAVVVEEECESTGAGESGTPGSYVITKCVVSIGSDRLRGVRW